MVVTCHRPVCRAQVVQHALVAAAVSAQRHSSRCRLDPPPRCRLRLQGHVAAAAGSPHPHNHSAPPLRFLGPAATEAALQATWCPTYSGTAARVCRWATAPHPPRSICLPPSHHMAPRTRGPQQPSRCVWLCVCVWGGLTEGRATRWFRSAWCVAVLSVWLGVA